MKINVTFPIKYRTRTESILVHLIAIAVLILPGSFFVFGDTVRNDNEVRSINARADEPKWHYSSIWADEEHMNDIVILDILSSTPGDEIITVSDNYFATMISGNGASWKAQRIFKDDFHLKSISVGDFYPHHPGNELAVAGFTGWVTMLYYIEDEGTWYSEGIYEDYDLLHDVAAGDIDPAHPGDELVCVGESRRLSYIYWDNATSSWGSEIIYTSVDLLNVVSLGELDPDSPGMEIVVTGGTFDITIITGTTGEWTLTNIWKDTTFVRELLITEFDGDESGQEVYVAGFSRQLTMVARNGSGSWTGRSIWNDKGAVGDVIAVEQSSDHNGTELVAVGASGLVVMLFSNESGIDNITLYNVPNSPTTIAVGDYDGYNDGHEFVLAEFRGRMTGLYTEKYGFGFLSPLNEIDAVPYEAFELDLLAVSNAGFSERVFLSYEVSALDPSPEQLPDTDDIKIDFEATSLIPTDFTGALITLGELEQGSFQLAFIAQADILTRYYNITINIIDPNILNNTVDLPGINIKPKPRLTSIVADRSSNFMMEYDGLTEYYFDYRYGISYIPDATRSLYFFIWESVSINFRIQNEPLGISLMEEIKSAQVSMKESKHVISLRADANVPVGKYYIFIISETLVERLEKIVKIERSRILELIVEPPGSPEFLVQISPKQDVEIYHGQEFEWTVVLNTLGGFSDSVDIDVENTNSQLELQTDLKSIYPTDIMKIKTNVSKNVDPSKFHLIVTGSQNGRFRFDIVSYRILKVVPGVDLTLDPEEITVDLNQPAEVVLTLVPTGGFSGDIQLNLVHLNAGNKIWDDYTLNLTIEETEILKLVLINLTDPGTFNFSIEVYNGTRIGEADFSVVVKAPKEPGNGGNDGDNGDEAGLTTTQSLLIMAVGLIVVILIFILLARRGRTDNKKDEKKQDTKPRK